MKDLLADVGEKTLDSEYTITRIFKLPRSNQNLHKTETETKQETQHIDGLIIFNVFFLSYFPVLESGGGRKMYRDSTRFLLFSYRITYM